MTEVDDLTEVDAFIESAAFEAGCDGVGDNRQERWLAVRFFRGGPVFEKILSIKSVIDGSLLSMFCRLLTCPKRAALPHPSAACM
jgi:hypothetical protein